LPKTQGKASNLTVRTHPELLPAEPTLGNDDEAPTSAPLAGRQCAPAWRAYAGNECALVNYENALDKLWED